MNRWNTVLRAVCAALGGVLLAAGVHAAVNITPENLAGTTAGSLPGHVAVTPSGASSYWIGFPVPPGTAGVAPVVGLVYNSQSGVDMLGLGWSLAAESQITRCGKSIATDGARRPVKLDAQDAFCLDGQRLILKSGSTTEYRTEIDGFSRITTVGGDAANGPASWKVEARTGQVLYYGTTAGSLFTAPGKTARLIWALAKSEDRYGNYISYHYADSEATGELYLTRIRYTANDAASLVAYNAINFIYEARPDPWMGYVMGSKLQRLKRLKTIEARIDTAADGSGGTLKRQFKVAYTPSATSGQSLVQGISYCDGADVCLPSTTFTWSTRDPADNTFQASGSGAWGGPSVTFSTDTATYGTKQQQLGTKVIAVDLNGDGRADLLQGNGGSNWNACLSTGTAFSCTAWAGPSVKTDDIVSGDFNGDGKTDIAVPSTAINGAIGTWKLCLSTGSAFSCTDTSARSYARLINRYMVGDFNADGRDDLLVIGDDYYGEKSWICPSSGSGFNACTEYFTAVDVFFQDPETAPPNDPRDPKYRLTRTVADLNGDGLPDLLQHIGNGGGAGAFVPHAAGPTGFVSAGQQAATISSGLSSVTGFSNVVDSNGDPFDRYADVHSGYAPNGGPFKTETCHFTGVQLICTVSTVPQSTSAHAANVADYDGDGRVDALSGGNTVVQINPDGTRGASAAWAAPLGSSSLTLRGDYNSDGIPDVAYYDEPAGSWTVSLAGSPAHSDLLASVTNGHGHQTLVEYKGLYDSGVYTRGSDVAYPQRNLTLGSPVVSRVRAEAASGETANQWLDTSYTYSGLRTDLQGRGLLGFEKMMVLDQQSNITTTTVFSQGYPTIGMAMSTESKHSSGKVIATTANTLRSFTTITGAHSPYVRQAVATEFDLGTGAQTLKTTTLVGTTLAGTDGIDTFGNITQAKVTTEEGADTFTATTASQYTNDQVNWLLGQRTSTTVTKTAPGVSSVTRTVGATYESTTGRLKTETVEPNTTALKLETVYGIDTTYGVVNSKTLKWYDPQSASNQTRVVETLAYDSKKRYPETVTNAKQHSEQRTYDPATGNLLTLTGPNALSTSWAYDGWGRKTREDRADATATTWAYKTCVDTCGYGGTSMAVTVTQQWAQVAGVDEQTVVPSETHFDKLGRQVMQRSWDQSGAWINSDTVYDAKGRLRKTSSPQTWADRQANRYGWTVYTRDDLGRPTQVQTTDKTGTGWDTTTIAYSGLGTTTTNPKLQARTETLNGLGKLKSAKDANNKTTSYVYDPFGNLKLTTDPKGNQIQVNYDMLGRKIQLIDPDLGTWNYRVNPLGQTYEQTDAKQQTTSFWFDELGRLKDRVEPDQQSHWIWDTAAKGIGKLAEAYNGPDTAKDAQRLHSYDSLGRPGKTIVRLDWDYSTTSSYNGYGQLSALKHGRDTIGQTTGGRSLTYNLSYNDQGAVRQVKRGSTLVWTRDSQDAQGRTTQATLAGSNLVTRRHFNDFTGRLQATETGTLAGDVLTPTIQDDAYGHDELGNMTSRSQLKAMGGAVISETFTYDSLNRLWKTKRGTNPEQTISYDELGNIVGKPNVGIYSYPASGATSVRPHAVSSITGTVAGLTNPSFSYDANGNLDLGLNRAYQWSAANYPTKIDKLTNGTRASATERDEFIYGPDRQKARQIVRVMSGQTEGAVKRTIYYGGAIEKEVDTTQTKTFIRTYLPEGIGYVEEVVNSVSAAPGTAPATTEERYFHKDHLGSINVITDATGVEKQRMGYDAWGRRRQAAGADDSWASLGTIANNQDNTGFTGQEQLDNVGLVHLNGRVYDPISGRLVSADPTVPDASDTQALNRYSYVINSPLGYTDPTGFAPFNPETVIRNTSETWAEALNRAFAQNLATFLGRDPTCPPAGFLAGCGRPHPAAGRGIVQFDTEAAEEHHLPSNGGSLEEGVLYRHIIRGRYTLADVKRDAEIGKARLRAQGLPVLDDVLADFLDPVRSLFLIGGMSDKNASRAAFIAGVVNPRSWLQRASRVAAKGTTTLYRAVGPAELANINKTGAFNNIAGIEGKYFTTSAAEASAYAKQAVKAFGDAPYTTVRTQVPNSVFKGLSPATVDGGIPAWVLPTDRLKGLVPNVMDHSVLPPLGF